LEPDSFGGLSPRFDWRSAAPRLVAVGLYAIAMAYVESAAVLYLRTIYGGIDPVGPRHTPFNPLPDFVWIEIGREAATMVMLATVAYLAAHSLPGRAAAFAVAMGTWDIFYYVFLRVFAGWPGSLLAPDVLFLIPLPWWGPVLSPVLIALVIIAAGGLAVAREFGDGLPRPRRADVLLAVLGGLVSLIVFMRDALAALPGGVEAAYYARGGPFGWPVFLIGTALGAFGLARIVFATPPRSNSQL
jgi:hypothetical protein